jgi:hypothetical protein
MVLFDRSAENPERDRHPLLAGQGVDRRPCGPHLGPLKDHRHDVDGIDPGVLRIFQLGGRSQAPLAVSYDICRNPVQPGAESLFCISVLPDAAQRLKKDFVGRVLRVGPGVEPGIGEGVNPVAIPLVQLAERLRTRFGAFDEGPSSTT